MATRIHFRYVATDQAGSVIQSAKVFVYQPGTTTDFTGLAYAAKTGGSSIANGFVTNNQGEAEAWFDTPQTVDIRVTDNTGAAFYPFAPSTLLTFSNVTEGNWDLEPAREDHPTAIGTAADLTDITSALQAEVVGTSGRWAPMDHVHGHAAFSVNPHGVGDHTDVTRFLWLKAEDATAITGAVATNIGTGLNISRVLVYVDTASNDATWTFFVPDDWASGALSAQVIWSPSASDVTPPSAVRWNYTSKSVSEGASVTAAGTAALFTGADANRTVDLLVRDTTTSTGVTPVAAGDLFLLNVQRIGADGADTYVGSVQVHGILVFYTAHQ